MQRLHAIRRPRAGGRGHAFPHTLQNRSNARLVRMLVKNERARAASDGCTLTVASEPVPHQVTDFIRLAVADEMNSLLEAERYELGRRLRDEQRSRGHRLEAAH